MIFRQYLHESPVIAASVLLGCAGKGAGAVVDPIDEIEEHVRAEEIRALNLGSAAGEVTTAG